MKILKSFSPFCSLKECQSKSISQNNRLIDFLSFDESFSFLVTRNELSEKTMAVPKILSGRDFSLEKLFQAE